MKRLILPLLFALAAYGAETDHGQLPDRKHVRQAAMALAEDFVPHPPVFDEMTKISNKESLAIFGDAQIGVLVAVKSDADKAGSDADLCLLLWKEIIAALLSESCPKMERNLRNHASPMSLILRPF